MSYVRGECMAMVRWELHTLQPVPCKVFLLDIRFIANRTTNSSGRGYLINMWKNWCKIFLICQNLSDHISLPYTSLIYQNGTVVAGCLYERNVQYLTDNHIMFSPASALMYFKFNRALGFLISYSTYSPTCSVPNATSRLNSSSVS